MKCCLHLSNLNCSGHHIFCRIYTTCSKSSTMTLKYKILASPFIHWELFPHFSAHILSNSDSYPLLKWFHSSSFTPIIVFIQLCCNLQPFVFLLRKCYIMSLCYLCTWQCWGLKILQVCFGDYFVGTWFAWSSTYTMASLTITISFWPWVM